MTYILTPPIGVEHYKDSVGALIVVDDKSSLVNRSNSSASDRFDKRVYAKFIRLGRRFEQKEKVTQSFEA